MNSGTSITLTTPSTTATHEGLIAVLALSGTATTVTSPAGWSLTLDAAGPSGPRVLVYQRAVASSEPSTHQWQLGGTMSAVGAILQYGAVDSSNPLPIVGVAGTGTTGTITAPAVTTTAANSIVLGVFAIAANQNIANPSPTFDNRRVDNLKASGAGAVGLEIHDELRTTAGSFGPATASYGGGAVSNLGVLLVLTPPVARFSAAGSSGAETTSSVNVAVTIGGPASVSVSVAFSLSGTATGGGTDYTLGTSSPLVFAAGESTKNIAITVADEALGERDETVVLTLGVVTNGEAGTPATHTYTILNDDARIQVASDPVLSDGTPDTGDNWGAWGAEPGASNVVGTNYLRIQNVGTITNEQVTISFDQTAFTLDPANQVSIPNNIYFATFQDTTPSSTRPDEGTYAFPSTPDTDGAITLTFSATSNYYYVLYRIGSISSPLSDGAYTATFTATAVG